MRKHERGVAAITAILVTVLAAIVTVAVMNADHVATRRAELFQNGEQAWAVAEGLESWIGLILERDAKNGSNDDLSEEWSKPVDYLPIDQGHASGGLIDAQGLFNLNNLAAQQPQLYAAQFTQMLGNLKNPLQIPPQQMIANIQDWMDADQNPSPPTGAEDTNYLEQSPAYRTADRLMSSPSELLCVGGMTKEAYAELRPYLIALPATRTTINVNTAPEAVLRSLGAQVDEGKLQNFLETRAQNPVKDVNAWLQLGIVSPSPSPTLLSVSTDYFVLHGEVVIGSGRVPLYSLIHRPKQGAPAVVSRGFEP